MQGKVKRATSRTMGVMLISFVEGMIGRVTGIMQIIFSQTSRNLNLYQIRY